MTEYVKEEGVYLIDGIYMQTGIDAKGRTL